MATDNTPPRLKLIATIAVITVITLISLDFVFKSYFAMMSDEAQREKIAPTRERDEQQKAEQAALAKASIPIDQAMAQIAKAGRPEVITPQPSEDLGPMTGWSKLPKPAPTPLPKAPEPPPAAVGDAGTTMLGPDGGAPLATDGGLAVGADAGGRLVPVPAGGAADAGARPHH
jgi:hypothetical protein